MNEKILITYASRSGSTAEVAEAIGKTLVEKGAQIDLLPIRDVKDLSAYRAVVVGSAIRKSKWLPEAMQFVQTHRAKLAEKPFATFTVCITLAMANSDRYRQAVRKWTAPVRAQVRPVSEGLFAGKLDFSKLPFTLDTILFRASVAFGILPKGDCRDWNAIRAWVETLRPMNTITKILLALVLLTGLSACAASYSVKSDADQVANAAAEIADFDLPAGYRADFTAHLMGYTVAAFNPGDGHSHLYLIQSEDEADGEKLADMLDQLAPGSSDPRTSLTVVETRPVTVRGEEGTLVISDGVNSEGDSYRQVTVAFQGLGGPALLVLSEPIERWDQETVDALLASIH